MTEQLYNRRREPQTPTHTTERGKPFRRYLGPCKRCGGSGHYSHNGEHSRCYRCIESGRRPNEEVYTELLYTLDQLDKMDATAAKKAARKAAKDEAARLARIEAEDLAREHRKAALQSDPLFQLLQKYADRNEFVAELLGKLRVRDLSEKQVEAATAACDRLAEADRLAASSDYLGEVGERVPVSGVVTLSKLIYTADPSGWRGGIPDADRYIVKVETDAGCVVVWFTANPLREGSHAEGKATVKACETRGGIKQTTVKNFRPVKVKQ